MLFRSKIHGDYVTIAAEVVSLRGVSSHADADGLLAWLRSNPVSPRRCFVTHGEPASADALRHRIEEELGWDCRVPAYGEGSEPMPSPSA